jgi:peptidyl-dipeptidase Dcp
MGAACYADYKLADTMAGTRDRVWALLDEVWQRALPALARERQMLREAMATAGIDHALEAWDWRYWAERVRRQRFALDEAALKPFFALPNMVAAAFECAQRLFGIRLQRRPDLQAYHPDVDVYEVLPEGGGAAIGLFLHDNFSRPAKRSGAWMSTLTVQHRNGDTSGRAVPPIVLNNNNFAKAPPGQPTLLSPDDVRTLFHEFGHALHGLLSDVGYQRISGTHVLRDFVELPSQLFEHWGTEREVLRRHARHWQTGEALPDALIDTLEAARRFGQGYETVRYTASAIVDLAAHEVAAPIDDIVAFEQQVMAARGLPADTGMNHRLPHFQHLFSGDSYAAGYYVYLWAEVLEADAFDAFTEAGSAFDAATAARLKACIYSRGDSVEPGAAFRAFRGRDAVITPMLRERGLI